MFIFIFGVLISQDIYEKFDMLFEAYTIIKENYVEDVDDEKLVKDAIKGMAGSLDPFTSYMEEESYKNLQIETKGKFGGIGIRIEIRDGWLTVQTPLPDTPAYKAGIYPGDRIIKIEDQSTEGITLEEAVNKLRGEPGTKVTITIQREGMEPFDVTLTRDIINIEAVKGSYIKDGVGYVRLYEFSEPAPKKLEDTIRSLISTGAKAIILDLRFNPGGLLSSAIDVAKLFIGDEKLIVYTMGKREPKKEYRADKKAKFKDIKLAVLVNGHSASASEIVASAIQDWKRGVVIGSKTFGKASVQNVFKLKTGALRLTVAKYYTPTGKHISKVGVTPDVLVELKSEDERKLFRQLEEIYKPGGIIESIVPEKERIPDIALEKAIEVLEK